MFRIVTLLAIFTAVLHLNAEGAEPASFVLVKFPVPEGWSRLPPERPNNVGVLLHGGKTKEEADGMIQLDIGKPVLNSTREIAVTIAGKDGSIDENPIRLAGVDALRVTSPSNDLKRPKITYIVLHEGQLYFLAAAAKPGFDLEPALKAIIETWQWRDTDRKRLTGEWEIQRTELGNKAVAGSAVPTELSFRDGIFTLSVKRRPKESMSNLLVTVDTKEKPAHLNIIRKMREELPCLYEVSEDSLTIAMPVIPKDTPWSELARPKGFASDAEPIMVIFAKRIPKKDEAPKQPEKRELQMFDVNKKNAGRRKNLRPALVGNQSFCFGQPERSPSAPR